MNKPDKPLTLIELYNMIKINLKTGIDPNTPVCMLDPDGETIFAQEETTGMDTYDEKFYIG